MAGEKAGIMKFTLKTGYSSDPVVMIKDAVEKIRRSKTYNDF